MLTQLDRDLAKVMDGLTAPGGMLATTPLSRFGRDLPMIASAPPTLGAYFTQFCTFHGAREFIVDGDVRLTFAQALEAARIAAGGLVAGHGLQKGDRVGIAARNSANWIVAYMAVLMAGGCAVLINGWWQGEEMAHGIDMVGCRMIIADRQRAERLTGIAHGAEIIPLLHDCLPSEGLAALTAKGGDAGTPLHEVGPDDLATILFTSGSTGVSKGAYSDHRGVVQGTYSYLAQSVMVLGLMTARGEAPPADSQPIALVNVPLFHVTGEVPLGRRRLWIVDRHAQENGTRGLAQQDRADALGAYPCFGLERLVDGARPLPGEGEAEFYGFLAQSVGRERQQSPPVRGCGRHLALRQKCLAAQHLAAEFEIG